MGYKGWENFKAGAKKPVSAKRQYQGYRNRELGAGLEEYRVSFQNGFLHIFDNLEDRHEN